MNTTQSNVAYSQTSNSRILRLYPIAEILRRIREAVSDLPKAMLFELRDLGYDSLFEQICGCIISVRTMDEVSLPAARRLLDRAKLPVEIERLSESEIYELIRPSSFGRQKARAIKEVARIAIEEFEERLPSDYQVLTDLPGLGPKAANLVLGVACKVPALGVDIHVHRVTNRWGYLNTASGEESLLALARKLPKQHWTEMNELLVPFGKNICTGREPKCSICPVFQYCERNGVRRSL